MKLIPQPKQIQNSGAVFNIGGALNATLSMKTADDRITHLLEKVLPNAKLEALSHGESFSLSIGTCAKEDSAARELLRDKKEGYFLKVEESGIYAFSWFAEGLFYAIQTLRQVLESNKAKCCTITDWPDVEGRAMYYDLRQTFPKFELLLKYIEEMAQFKSNAVIIEYEDKLPFRKYTFLRHKQFCLTDEQMQQLKQVAYENFVEIIPLQQAFGHLEYVLKYPEFENLRETESDLGELCPCKPGSIEISRGLLLEMIEQHPESRYIHIGCDEVWSLCTCEACKAAYPVRERAFIEFVNKLIDFVCAHGKTPILWHDMLAHCSNEDLASLDKRGIVMIWLYSDKTVRRNVPGLAPLFKKHGIKMMAGCAVRCHDGDDTQNHPVIEERIKNIDQWAVTVEKYDIPFMVSTNWATAFAMGAPYGIFETSLYSMYYAGDKFWNANTDKNTFLNRFLRIFHGIDDKLVDNEATFFGVDGYFKLLPEILDSVMKNKEIADCIKAVADFDSGLRRLSSANAYIYRYGMFRDGSGDMVSLKARAHKYIADYMKGRENVTQALEQFLPKEMAKMYVEARCYPNDYLINHFYADMFEDLG